MLLQHITKDRFLFTFLAHLHYISLQHRVQEFTTKILQAKLPYHCLIKIKPNFPIPLFHDMIYYKLSFYKA